MDKKTNKKILALVSDEYMKRIPLFIRSHATQKTCQLIEKEFPEIYAAFQNDIVSKEAEAQMRVIINEIFEKRMKKHNL